MDEEAPDEFEDGKADGAFRRALGQLVRERRLKLGWSQKDLFVRSNVPVGYISDFERGTRNITLDSAEKLIRALKLDPAKVTVG